MVSVKGGGSDQHWVCMSGIDWPVMEYSPRFFRISAASGFNSGLVKSPTRPALSSMVPSAFLTRLTIGPGPEAGSSRLNTVRPHSPERAGMEAPVSALVAGQGEIAAAISPRIVQPILFPEMLRMFPLQRHGRNFTILQLSRGSSALGY